MSLKWKPTFIGHMLQAPDTVHTATFAVASGHGTLFESLLRNTTDYVTSIVTTDQAQMNMLCAAVIIPATVLLLRRITRDLKPSETISLKDKVIIQKQIAENDFATSEQHTFIQNKAKELGVDIHTYIAETFNYVGTVNRKLENLTKHEARIVENMLERIYTMKSSSIRGEGQDR